MNKRLLSLLLVVCMLVNILPLQVLAREMNQGQLINESVEALPFSDVNKDNWFYDAVNYAYSHGLFDDLITPEQKATIEPLLLAQVQASNFASDAAFMLADMASKTNSFRNIDCVQKVFFRDENGNPISEEKVALLNLGGSF